MELDPIEAFLQQGTQRFSLSMLVNAHARLSSLQLSKGAVTFDDIVQSLTLTSSTDLSPIELNAHAALMYEGTLVPVLTAKGPVLRLNKEMIGNDVNFLKGVTNLMILRANNMPGANGAPSPITEDFKNDCASFLKKLGITPPTPFGVAEPTSTVPPSNANAAVPVTDDNVSVGEAAVARSGASVASVEGAAKSSPSLQAQASPTLSNLNAAMPGAVGASALGNNPVVPVTSSLTNFASAKPYVPSSATVSALNPNAAPVNPALRVPPGQPQPPMVGGVPPGAPMAAPRAAPRPFYPPEEVDTMPITETERTEPIAHLLAYIRKEGMDILFPPIVHDKVLMSIFAAIKCAAPLAHRELIDMVMAVKEAAAVTQLEHLTRTKVRGVLALLKYAQLFVTHGAEGDAVRLHLASGITSFRDLRDRHDAFLNRYLMLHHIFVPIGLKSELVWQLDPDTKNRRLEELKSLEFVLLDFFKTYYMSARAKLNPAAAPSMQPPMIGGGSVPPSAMAPSDYANYGNKPRYAAEIMDDRYRGMDGGVDPRSAGAAGYDPYARARPPAYPGAGGGNLVYSSGRAPPAPAPAPVTRYGNTVIPPAGAAPMNYNQPAGYPSQGGYRPPASTSAPIGPGRGSVGYPRGESDYMSSGIPTSSSAYSKPVDHGYGGYGGGSAVPERSILGEFDGLTGGSSAVGGASAGSNYYYGGFDDNAYGFGNNSSAADRFGGLRSSSAAAPGMLPESGPYGNTNAKKDIVSSLSGLSMNDSYGREPGANNSWSLSFGGETTFDSPSDPAWSTSAVSAPTTSTSANGTSTSPWYASTSSAVIEPAASIRTTSVTSMGSAASAVNLAGEDSVSVSSAKYSAPPGLPSSNPASVVDTNKVSHDRELDSLIAGDDTGLINDPIDHEGENDREGKETGEEPLTDF